MRMRMPRSPRRKTTAPAAREAGFTPPFYRCSPPERALARGGGGGFGCSDGEASGFISARAGRRLEQFGNRVLGARPMFDQIAQRKFPAFRSLDLREILPTHAFRQRLISALPELSPEFVKHVSTLSHCEP